MYSGADEISSLYYECKIHKSNIT